jgi:hypothetical protein
VVRTGALILTRFSLETTIVHATHVVGVLHAVPKGSTLVRRVVDRTSETTVAIAAAVAKGGESREPARRMREALATTLHKVRLERHVMELTALDMQLTKARVGAEGVEAVLCSIDISKPTALVHRRQVAPCAKAMRTHAHTVAVHAAHMVMVGAVAKVVNLLALKLVLNTLAIGCVADERQDRANTLNEKSTLSGISIVKSSL